MYLHMTVAKIVPYKVRQACQVLTSEEQSSSFQAIQGLRLALLIESMDEPGRITWLSLWSSSGEAQDFITSPVYAEVMARLKPYLLSDPQWFGYNVLKALPVETE